ncbi:hypothetical protein K7X08_011313 [Anisodus acutangulus]|uniref:Uncharacterized protein n=1 Tax=Anisodus acutangulus TaxID=402998 RepID=A0A9Q1RAD0_9SOLA|nr:hypothetical protein K7X08_011313 [Anisodus acutangulus]
MSAHPSPTLDDFLTIQGSAKSPMAPHVVATRRPLSMKSLIWLYSLLSSRCQKRQGQRVRGFLRYVHGRRGQSIKSSLLHRGMVEAEYIPNSFSTQGCPQMR